MVVKQLIVAMKNFNIGALMLLQVIGALLMVAVRLLVCAPPDEIQFNRRIHLPLATSAGLGQGEGLPGQVGAPDERPCRDRSQPGWRPHTGIARTEQVSL